MNRRRLILEEMGIAPLWRLRASGSASLDRSPPGEHVSAEAAIAEEQPAIGPSAPAQVVAGPSQTGFARSNAPPDGVEADDRRARILRMDWSALKASVAQCTACPLHAKRTNTVFGVGGEQADWLFVGEGPGAEEDAKGEPFVGQAGRLLDNMLAAIDLKRGENVYIANVVKCRPPGNRNPEAGEMHRCEPFLTRQIALIEPRLIVAMGKVAASHLLDTTASIASLRGRVHEHQGAPLIVTYHPAYLLRNLPDKAKAWADLCFARDTMSALPRRPARERLVDPATVSPSPPRD
jgi:uracil-DNA glycosylase family 4